MTNWLELSANNLLDEFGAGGHKPGSGSAAALEGLLSAQLQKTVIDLTLPKSDDRRYAKYLSKLAEIRSRIENELIPTLKKLLQEDADQFGEVIASRKVRNARKKDPFEYKQKDDDALAELDEATKIPLEIADVCVELLKSSFFVFEHGFQSARGDSGVAMCSALAALRGCLCVVDLNLCSTVRGDRPDRYSRRAVELRSTLEMLESESRELQQRLNSEAQQRVSLREELNSLSTDVKSGELSKREIENLANQVKLALWHNPAAIRGDKETTRIRHLLKPKPILRLLGFHLHRETNLGEIEIDGETYKVAAEIDQDNRVVQYSDQFRPETQNFTIAHELGHALMHDHPILHRDRPVGASEYSGKRNETERQADYFASCFLMPRSQVRSVFERLFKTLQFRISDDTSFALTSGTVDELLESLAGPRDLGHVLAKATYYDGESFEPLATRFNVSVKAMAIRLEELELYRFP